MRILRRLAQSTRYATDASKRKQTSPSTCSLIIYAICVVAVMKRTPCDFFLDNIQINKGDFALCSTMDGDNFSYFFRYHLEYYSRSISIDSRHVHLELSTISFFAKQIFHYSSTVISHNDITCVIINSQHKESDRVVTILSGSNVQRSTVQRNHRKRTKLRSATFSRDATHSPTL